ncbi:unnamed protein product [Paramecium sonneborni]|uniref:Uncharacterized protein n=1 Tax=Paramecium sonneborni TaxID=65129 RepID=A0A8S1QIV3_9CILI|nr:unnamed protein product [Paramecium sonneborni]
MMFLRDMLLIMSKVIHKKLGGHFVKYLDLRDVGELFDKVMNLQELNIIQVRVEVFKIVFPLNIIYQKRIKFWIIIFRQVREKKNMFRIKALIMIIINFISFLSFSLPIKYIISINVHFSIFYVLLPLSKLELDLDVDKQIQKYYAVV